MREVKRRAKIGEKIKIVDAFCHFGLYKDGDVLTVSKILGDSEGGEGRACVKEFEKPFILAREYVVLEGENKVRFKVGDKVRIVKNTNGHSFEIGQFVRIIKVTNTDYYAGPLDGTEGWWVTDEELEPAPFTLYDLKPCMVVKIRNSQFLLVSRFESGTGLVDEREQQSLYFDDFNDDLTFKPNSNLDIIEVYGYRKDYLISSLELSSVKRELLWKREEPKPKRKMTVAEICKELGEEIEIVKGE